jgi:peptidoglycan hydrolase CwlO-like protein
LPAFARPNIQVLFALTLLVAFAVVAPSSGDSVGSLNDKIGAETQAIEGANGHLKDVRNRLAKLQQDVAIQENLLAQTQADLRAKHAKLARLQGRESRGREILAQQLVANYETPPPNLVNVVMDSKGFADLLERMDAIKAIERQNASTIERLKDAQVQVAAETKRLQRAEIAQTRQAVTVAAQRDQIAEIELSLARRQKLRVDRRAGMKRKLKEAQKNLATAQARAAAASGVSIPDVNAPTSIPGFTPHGGKYGFFQGAGTNYSYGDEPKIVARLDALGLAAHLHLIGISGYRTPQHSMEVGGFANDPHTRGEASDTLGVEGVPQVTLSKFGLWRPFSAASELNHIQLLGSSKSL